MPYKINRSDDKLEIIGTIERPEDLISALNEAQAMYSDYVSFKGCKISYHAMTKTSVKQLFTLVPNLDLSKQACLFAINFPDIIKTKNLILKNCRLDDIYFPNFFRLLSKSLINTLDLSSNFSSKSICDLQKESAFLSFITRKFFSAALHPLIKIIQAMPLLKIDTLILNNNSLGLLTSSRLQELFKACHAKHLILNDNFIDDCLLNACLPHLNTEVQMITINNATIIMNNNTHSLYASTRV